MPSTLDWLVAGAAAGGLVWYARRSQREADTVAEVVARVAATAEARANLASAVAHADRAVAAGNAAGAAEVRARLAAAVAQGDRAVAAGNAAGAAAATSTAEARAHVVAAVAQADRAVAAGNAAAAAEARARLAAAVAQADRAVAAGNAAGQAAGGTTSIAPSPWPAATSPAAMARPAAPPPPRTSRLTRRFDELFDRHGAGIPRAYLRALAHAESGMRPDDPLGLINIVPIALADYNRRHPATNITAAQMRDPAINVRVAADTLNEVIASYQRNHSDLGNLRVDWSNPRFVELLTTGWNAGYSERCGVGRVLRHLKEQPADRRPREITIDAVFAVARPARATRHLSNPRKLAYAKRVTAAYFRELALEPPNSPTPLVA